MDWINFFKRSHFEQDLNRIITCGFFDLPTPRLCDYKDAHYLFCTKYIGDLQFSYNTHSNKWVVFKDYGSKIMSPKELVDRYPELKTRVFKMLYNLNDIPCLMD